MDDTLYPHWSVDWSDDMLVDERHFRHEQARVEHLVGWGLVRSWGTYGIVHQDDASSSLKILLEEIDPSKYLHRIVVRNCVAVTPSGLQVYVRGDRREEYSVSEDVRLDDRDSRYEIFIDVDPFSPRDAKVGYDNEVPLASPVYKLRCEKHRKGRTAAPMSLKLGELLVEDGYPRLHEHYIPPCTGLQCSEHLVEAVNQGLKLFHSILRHSMRIALDKRVGLERSEKKVEGDPISSVFFYLCDHLAIWLGGNIDRIELEFQTNRPPSTYFLFTKQFFRLFDSILEELGQQGRDSFYNRWSEWNADFTTKERFDRSLRDVLNHRYDHTDLKTYIDLVHELLIPFSRTLEAFEVKKPEPKDKGIIQGIRTEHRKPGRRPGPPRPGKRYE